MNFLYYLFIMLIDFKKPGLTQGEKNLLCSLPLMIFKGKQSLYILEYSSIKLLKASLGSSWTKEDQFLFKTFSLNLCRFSSVILRVNTLFLPTCVKGLSKKYAKTASGRINHLERHHLRRLVKDCL